MSQIHNDPPPLQPNVNFRPRRRIITMIDALHDPRITPIANPTDIKSPLVGSMCLKPIITINEDNPNEEEC